MRRTALEESMEVVYADLLKLNEKTKVALLDSVNALKEKDINQSEQIIDKDHEIDELEKHINDEIVWLMMKERPVATDLRRLMVILKISNDLERIADLAVNIAKSNIRIGQIEITKPLEDVSLVADKALHMLDIVMEAFQQEDLKIAKQVLVKREELKSLHGQLIEQLLHYMSEDSSHLTQITQLAFVYRDLERVGDHVTNMSENIEYLVRGRKYD